jgi:hypothetical protein
MPVLQEMSTPTTSAIVRIVNEITALLGKRGRRLRLGFLLGNRSGGIRFTVASAR